MAPTLPPEPYADRLVRALDLDLGWYERDRLLRGIFDDVNERIEEAREAGYQSGYDAALEQVAREQTPAASIWSGSGVASGVPPKETP